MGETIEGQITSQHRVRAFVNLESHDFFPAIFL